MRLTIRQLPSTTLLAALLILGTAAVTSHGAGGRASECNGLSDICEFMKRYVDAFNTRDFDAFRATFADDITFFVDRPFPPQRVDGKAAAEAIFRRGFAYYHPTAGVAAPPLPPPIVPAELRLQAFGDAAVVSFVLNDSTQVARRTLVLHRTSSGWHVVHIHGSSADIPPK